ncbi:MAG: hypothetical protein M3R17_14800 [Bacteroidota bacterium]|nr:hypothetical protein [Bacteroidota bacterium]
MNRKARNLVWMFLLLLISFPTGYFVQYVGNPRFIRRELILNIVAGGIACIIVVGAISTIFFFILRNRRKDDPAKPALLLYSFIIALMFIFSIVQMPNAVKEHDRHEFLESLRETLTTSYTKMIAEMPDAPPELKEHAQEVSVCIFYGIKRNDELVDKMMTVPDPKNFTATSPEIKKIVEDCFSLYMEE